MRIAKPVSLIAILWELPAFGADAPDFTTFYNQYKNPATTNDIAITADITATRLISVAGAETTTIDGGGFDFSGGNFGGFIISRGYNFSLHNGGTFDTDAQNITIEKSLHNFVQSSEGGVIANLGGNITIENTAFTDNTSTLGGGVFYQNNNAILNATNAAFQGNRAIRGDGGVIYSEYETTATFSNVYFLNNSASNYGGVAFNDGTLNITNGTFHNNSAPNGGAALYNSNEMNLTNVSFYNNTSTDGAGAIYTTGDLNLNGGTFDINSGTTGGAIGNYGIIGDTLYSVISNSTFTGNTATYGGAIYNWDDIYVIDSTFTNNSATDGGGAIFNLSELYIIANESDVSFTGNTSGGVSNAIQSSGTININASTNNAVVFNDAIAGDGDIIINRPYIYDQTNVPTSGTIILNQDMREFTGNVMIYNGTVVVPDGGNFFSANTLNILGGTLNLGTSNAAVSNATFAAGATLAVEIENSTLYGSLTANTWSIADEATLNVILQPDAMDGANSMRVQLLRGGNISDNFTPHINNNIYDFIKIGDGWYEITQSGDYTNVINNYGGTQNNSNTAAAWQNEPKFIDSTEHEIFDRMNTLMQTDGVGYIRALTALAPPTAPLVQIIGTSLANRFEMATAVYDRQTYDTGRGKLWTTIFGGGAHLSSTGQYAQFDTDGYGGAIGAEFNTNKWTIGAAYTYQHDEMDSWTRSIVAPTYGVGLYAKYDANNIIWRIKGAAFYTDMDETKYVAGINVYNNPSLYTYGTWSDIGYRFTDKNWSLTPRAGMQYIITHRTSSTDSASQSISSANTNFLTAYADIIASRGNMFLGGVGIVPELRIGTSYDLRTDADNATVYVNNATYNISSVHMGRIAGYAGARVRAVFSPTGEIQIGANVQLRDGYRDYTINARGVLKF